MRASRLLAASAVLPAALALSGCLTENVQVRVLSITPLSAERQELTVPAAEVRKRLVVSPASVGGEPGVRLQVEHAKRCRVIRREEVRRERSVQRYVPVWVYVVGGALMAGGVYTKLATSEDDSFAYSQFIAGAGMYAFSFPFQTEFREEAKPEIKQRSSVEGCGFIAKGPAHVSFGRGAQIRDAPVPISGQVVVLGVSISDVSPVFIDGNPVQLVVIRGAPESDADDGSDEGSDESDAADSSDESGADESGDETGGESGTE